MRKVSLAALVGSPRVADVLMFLYDAHPLPLPVRTIARGCVLGAGASLATAEKRTWELLNVLRAAKLLTSSLAPTRAGRPPSHFSLTKQGIDLLIALDRVTKDDLAAKPRAHKSFATLLKRRHDLLVHEVKSALMYAARTDERLGLESVTTDHSTWRETIDPRTGSALSIAPDLAAVVVFNGARVLIFFEVQGTASHLQAVIDKCAGFVTYVESGAASADYGNVKHFRVLFPVFSDDPHGAVDHTTNILEAASEVRGTDRLVLASPIQRVVEDGFLAPTWMRVADLTAWKGTLPEPLQAVFQESRHAANRVRAERDRRLAVEVARCAWFR